MTFDAKVVRVLIASPGDTGPVRKLLRELLEDWNGLNAEDSSVMLLPVMWERDSTPEMGDRPQAVINRQIVDVADVLIGVFWTRLGTPTGEAQSGTVEEVERFIAADKPVLLYFSNQPVLPDSVDPDEYGRLREFKKSLGERGLYDSYESEAELWRKANAGVTRVMREAFRVATDAEPTVAVAVGPRAALSVRVERERELAGVSKQGNPRYRTRERLILENFGTAAAESLKIDFEPSPGQDGEVPSLLRDDGLINRLAANGRLEFPLLLHMGTASQWEVHLRWTEDGHPYDETQTVRG